MMIPKYVLLCMVLNIVGYLFLQVDGEVRYECSDVEGPCILLNVNAEFNLTKVGLHPKNAKNFDLKEAKVLTSQCVCPDYIYDERRMVLQLPETGETLEWHFNAKATTVKLVLIFNLDPSKHFVNESSGPISLNTSSTIVLADIAESYLCVSDESVAFNERALFRLNADLTNFQVQAFTVNKGHFGPVGRECPADLKSSSPAPISSTYSSQRSTISSSTHSTKDGSTTSSHASSTPSSLTPSSSTGTHVSSSPAVTTQPTSTNPSSTNSSPIATKNATTRSSPVTSRITSSTPKSPSTHTSPSLPTHTSPTYSSSSMSPLPSSSFSTGSTPKTTQTTRTTNPSTQSSHTPSGSTSHKVTTGSQATTSPVSSQMTTQATTPASVMPKFGLKDPDDQYYCIVIQGKIEFEIPYTSTNGKASTIAIELSRNATVTGSCSVNGTNNTQDITLSFNNGWSFGVVIGTLNNEPSLAGPIMYSWEKIDMTYVLDDHFYNPKNKGQRREVSAIPAFDDFKATSKGCYKCISRQSMKLKTVTLDLSDLQYFGFGLTDSEDFPKSDVSECAADHAQTTMSPSTKSPSHSHGGAIAGGIIGGLVVVALVVGSVTFYRRKMNKATPYEDL